MGITVLIFDEIYIYSAADESQFVFTNDAITNFNRDQICNHQIKLMRRVAGFLWRTASLLTLSHSQRNVVMLNFVRIHDRNCIGY